MKKALICIVIIVLVLVVIVVLSKSCNRGEPVEPTAAETPAGPAAIAIPEEPGEAVVVATEPAVSAEPGAMAAPDTAGAPGMPVGEGLMPSPEVMAAAMPGGVPPAESRQGIPVMPDPAVVDEVSTKLREMDLKDVLAEAVELDAGTLMMLSGMLQGRILTYAKGDPEAALALLKQGQPQPLRDAILVAAGGLLVKQEPAEAAEWAVSVGEGKDRFTAIQTVVKHWSGRDPEAALAWIRTLPDGDAKQAAQATGGRALGILVRTDPAHAAELAESLPEGDARFGAVMSIVSRWVREDPGAAVAWVESLPAGRSKDQGIALIVRRMKMEPEEKIAMVETMGNPAFKDNLLRQVAQEWVQKDPAAAAEWIKGSSLRDVHKKWLLGRVGTD